MKNILWLTVMALAMPMAAFANGVDFSNSGGTLAGTKSGLSLTGSTLIAVNGLNGGGLITGNDLGSMSFTTGALMAGGSLAERRNVRRRRFLRNQWQWHERSSQWRYISGNVQRSCDLDAGDPGEWHSQLHSDRRGFGSVDYKRRSILHQRRYGATDDQHWPRLFQRRSRHLQRRYERISSGTGFARLAGNWSGRSGWPDPAQVKVG